MFAGAACTWARSIALMETERSEQETNPSGASKSSELNRALRYFFFFFFARMRYAKQNLGGATSGPPELSRCASLPLMKKVRDY